MYALSNYEVIDFVKQIKIIGIGTEGCLLASLIPSNMPNVRVLLMQKQAFVEDKNDEVLAKTLTDANLLFIATNITDAANQRNVERVISSARKQGVLVLGVALSCTQGSTQRTLQIWNSNNVDALLVGDHGKLYTELQTAAYEVAAIVNGYGHVNVDFEDVRTILSMRGVISVGTSTAGGPDRAQRAALNAIQDINLTQANGLMVLLSGAKGGLKLSESRQALTTINSNLPESAHVIFGAAYDESLGDQLRVTVLVSGLPYPSSA